MTHLTTTNFSNPLTFSQNSVVAAQQQLNNALGGMNVAQGALTQLQQPQAQPIRPAVAKRKQFNCKRGPVSQAQRFNHFGPNVMGGGCKTPNSMMPQQFMGGPAIPQPVVGLPTAPVAGQPAPAVPAQSATPAVPTSAVAAVPGQVTSNNVAAQVPGLPVAQQQATSQACGCSGGQSANFAQQPMAGGFGFGAPQGYGFQPMAQQGFPGSPFGNMFGTPQGYGFQPMSQQGFSGSPFGNMFGAPQGYGFQPMSQQGFSGSPFGNMFGAAQPGCGSQFMGQQGFSGSPFGAQGFNTMPFGGQQAGGMASFGGGYQYAQNGGVMDGWGQSWGQQSFNPMQQGGGCGFSNLAKTMRNGFSGLSQQMAQRPTAATQSTATPAQPTTAAGMTPEQQNPRDFAKDIFAGLTRTANNYGQMIASASPELRPSLLQSQNMHNDYSRSAIAALQTGSIYRGAQS